MSLVYATLILSYLTFCLANFARSQITYHWRRARRSDLTPQSFAKRTSTTRATGVSIRKLDFELKAACF